MVKINPRRTNVSDAPKNIVDPVVIQPAQLVLNQVLHMASLKAEDRKNTDSALDTLYNNLPRLKDPPKSYSGARPPKIWHEIPFGKYKTHPIKEVPTDYLEWAIDEIKDMEVKWPGLYDSIKNVLEGIA